jgi:hypothetical protein
MRADFPQFCDKRIKSHRNNFKAHLFLGMKNLLFAEFKPESHFLSTFTVGDI